MLSAQEWQSLAYYKKSDFGFPDRLKMSIVKALDNFAFSIREKAVVLSDWRPFSLKRSGSRHPEGTAIDVTFPGTDPLYMLDKIKAAQLFSGIGIYLNEKGQTSFHLDTRWDRRVTDPATWGCIIRPTVDPATGQVTRTQFYTGMAAVVDLIGAPVSAVLLGLVVLAWFLFRKS